MREVGLGEDIEMEDCCCLALLGDILSALMLACFCWPRCFPEKVDIWPAMAVSKTSLELLLLSSSSSSSEEEEEEEEETNESSPS